MTRMLYDINEINRETTAQLASRARCIIFLSVRSCENAPGFTLPLPIVAICYQKFRVATNISHWLKVQSRWSKITYLRKSVF